MMISCHAHTHTRVQSQTDDRRVYISHDEAGCCEQAAAAAAAAEEEEEEKHGPARVGR